MIRINLIAVDREKVKKKPGVRIDDAQKVTLLCSLILVVTALGIGWWWWSLEQAKTHMATEITNQQREAARLKSILTQVADFEKQKQQLEGRVSLIEDLRKGQGAGVHMLDELSKALPEMLWLTTLKQDGGELTVEGRCTSLTALSDFVANLEHSSYFRKPVEIIDSQSDQAPGAAPGGSGDLIKFTLKATYALPGTDPAPTAAKSAARR
jgi:type IV pilus assembly protein PilN